jgi:hypothetical protein
MTRTDIHRPSAPQFDPEAYTFYGVFDSNPEEGDSKERVQTVANLVNRGYRFGANSSGQCGHCGTMIRYGALMVRDDVKEFIFVGQTCLDTRFESLTAAEFKRLRESARLNRERATKKERVAAILAENPGLEVALTTDDWIVEDIATRLQQRGEISEKQIELVFKVARRNAERIERAAQREIDDAAKIANGVQCPNGKVTVTGIVVSTKMVDSDWGTTQKMLVESDEGWKVWGTVPRALDSIERGSRVTFTAQVEASADDQLFGYFKRPNKARILLDEMV